MTTQTDLPEGASPLTRGKLTHIAVLPLGDGRIPAHAGKTRSRLCWTPSSRAHPRSRGENAPPPSISPSRTGASPLTRGKREAETGEHVLGGRIPAHAGKTRTRPPRIRTPRAHPRSRGENNHEALRAALCQGASPLTRGKHPLANGLRVGGGRIPAHAGKTPVSVGPPVLDRAHPRSRGENGHGRRFHLRPRGASPLTRGKLTSPDEQLIKLGRIPAHAGKTTGSPSTVARTRAHPRSRGENGGRHGGDPGVAGASPLTRGKPGECRARRDFLGRIPAHAGKTRTRRRANHARQAHPRSRGENADFAVPDLRGRGASPLTRGKPFLTCAFIAQIGQILESRELCASSESYSLRNVYATAAPQDQVRSIGLAPLSSRGAS